MACRSSRTIATADIIWDGKRPPALYAMSQHGGVVHIGSFSKSIAPALRVGYIVAPWEMMSRMLPLKHDAGSGAIEQMVLAEYCSPHFNERMCRADGRACAAKLDTMMEALNEQFGTAAEFEEPRAACSCGSSCPTMSTRMKLYQPALAAGVAINPGPEWSVDKAHSQEPDAAVLRRARPTTKSARASRRWPRSATSEFGVPARISNVKRGYALDSPGIIRHGAE